MVDFELAIINTILEILVNAIIRAYLFHLNQSVFRLIQKEGLQELYNNWDDSSIRDATQQMCALAFVSVDEVVRVFCLFQESVPQIFKNISKYFDVGKYWCK